MGNKVAGLVQLIAAEVVGQSSPLIYELAIASLGIQSLNEKSKLGGVLPEVSLGSRVYFL